jgi:hypothetical protein
MHSALVYGKSSQKWNGIMVSASAEVGEETGLDELIAGALGRI